MRNFWQDLPKPIFCLAPMADVTDAAFRFLIAKYSKYGGQEVGDGNNKQNLPRPLKGAGPDVMWTEFVSVDGLCSVGREHLMIDLEYSEIERPIVAQIFGSKPENFYEVAKLLKKLKFDGIDINMGCPEKNVERQGCGAALIKNPALAQEIIKATKEGGGGLPVSVKTRIGYNTNIIEEWTEQLLEVQPAAITFHLRTRKEMSKVPARWEDIPKALALAKGTNTLILGNGDVANLTEAQQKVDEYGVDGVMIGRGIFGNPWLFNRERTIDDLLLKDKLEVMLEHANLFEKKFAGKKNFLIMRKHMGAYIKGYDHIKDLRVRLMETTNARAVADAIGML